MNNFTGWNYKENVTADNVCQSLAKKFWNRLKGQN